MKYWKHNSAIVDKGATIGEGTKIWHWSHICSGAIIGNECVFGQNTFVGNNAKIGNNVKIQNNVSIYDNVLLEDGVFCGPSVVFTNVINPRSLVERKEEYIDTVIREGVSLGANCTIICGAEIGRYAFIGAGSVVTKNVPDYALMVGVPAKQIGWISEYGQRILFTKDNNNIFTCKNTKSKYMLKDNICQKLDL
jgi:UDP-2-acetamido-3-amino-2,3-dideoxy-glucuronate N-acetyltransferase